MERDYKEFDSEINIKQKSVIHFDKRGHFFELFNPDSKNFFSKNGIDFSQINVSKSKKIHTFRGLHFQKKPYEQSKFLRVLNGSIIDILVDIRNTSKHFLDHAKIPINEESDFGLFIPKGFAHGFLTTSENVVVEYLVDEIFMSNYDSGISFKDEELSIELNIKDEDLIISDKDLSLPKISELKKQGVL